MRKAAAAALAVVAIAVAGCTSGGPTASSTPVVGAAGQHGLSWHPCPQDGGGAPAASRMVCAKLQVPLDYQRPDGRKITLALSEVPATAPAAKQQGALLVNPGGPGASGLALAAVIASLLSPSVAADYNIIGFDTRGVGSSVPALHCDPSFFSKPRPDYVPSSSAAEQVLVDRAKLYAADCEKKYGWLLPYMTTEDIARDMDSIRAALGQQKISYYGISYGTYLGEVYATLFPHRVRRMILDSVVDPNGVWYADNISQDYAFQGRMNALFAWMARYNSTYHLGATQARLSATYNAVMAKLESRPISTSSGPLIGPDELTDTFLIGGYSNSYWPELASALASYLQHGSASQLISLYEQVGQQNENEFAVYSAVECSDVNWPRSWAYWNADTRQVYKAAPFEAWGNAWFNAACAFWPVKGPAKPLRIGAAGLPPILMLQGTLDAATPYSGALVARRLLPSARLVVVQGSGNHGQSVQYPPNTCVEGYVNNYLGSGGLPANPGLVNATCATLPPPSP